MMVVETAMRKINQLISIFKNFPANAIFVRYNVDSNPIYLNRYSNLMICGCELYIIGEEPAIWIEEKAQGSIIHNTIHTGLSPKITSKIPITKIFANNIETVQLEMYYTRRKKCYNFLKTILAKNL